MRNSFMLGLAGLVVLGTLTPGAAQRGQRLNPVIELLEEQKPVFGFYAPSNRRPGGRGGPAAPAGTTAGTMKSPLELAREAVAMSSADFIFDGSMEGGLERALPAFTEFASAMRQAGVLRTSPALWLSHPLIVKTPVISEPGIASDIASQLNLGVSGLMFPEAENAGQVRTGIAAMRFAAQGGTRPAEVGSAPAFWGMSEEDYRRKADLWPLNPQGELINWTIVESREGLARVREIAAVKGIGVLWPGAGTLRGVFTGTNAAGERVFDEQGWENAIQSVLAACKEFNVACGYPAGPNDIELRMKQGFSVFVMAWGEPGFRTVEIGRRLANRTPTSN